MLLSILTVILKYYIDLIFGPLPSELTKKVFVTVYLFTLSAFEPPLNPIGL